MHPREIILAYAQDMATLPVAGIAQSAAVNGFTDGREDRPNVSFLVLPTHRANYQSWYARGQTQAPPNVFIL